MSASSLPNSYSAAISAKQTDIETALHPPRADGQFPFAQVNAAAGAAALNMAGYAELISALERRSKAKKPAVGRKLRSSLAESGSRRSARKQDELGRVSADMSSALVEKRYETVLLLVSSGGCRPPWEAGKHPGPMGFLRRFLAPQPTSLGRGSVGVNVMVSLEGHDGLVGDRKETFAVAPMMDVTDRHFNRFVRSISRHATIWSEMVVASTVIYNPERVFEFFKLMDDGASSPAVLQLGGSDPDQLARAAAMVKPLGYDEINLNCGCPSDKVSGKGCFGAALMKSPELVAEIASRMSEAVQGEVEISIKCRIGVDDIDSYENLANFVRTVSTGAGVRHFVIHARTAILKGLSPAQNREIPPLKYDYVYNLLRDFPELRFTINGGVKTIEAAEEHLQKGVHGVMLGRAVRDRTWDALRLVDRRLYNDFSVGRSRREIILEYAEYADGEDAKSNVSRVTLCKPFINAFHGERGSRKFRAAVSNGIQSKSILESVQEAFLHLDSEALDRLPHEEPPPPPEVLTRYEASPAVTSVHAS